jgi:hypothetical protein
MHRRRFLQLAGRLGALMGVPGLEAVGQPSVRKKVAKSAHTLTTSLDKGWLVAMDAKNVGHEAAWFRAAQPEAKATRVPSVLQETFPGYHGVAWYWLQFVPEPQPFVGGRYLLRFHAVDYLADVWLNSNHLGSHEGGQTPFVLDATDFIRPGASNTISLRVLNPDNERIDGILLGETPHGNKSVRFQNGSSYDFGGILLPVELLLTPAMRIDGLHLRPDWRTGQVDIECAVNNTSAQAHAGQVHFSISRTNMDQPQFADEAEFTIAPGSSNLTHRVRIRNHRLWALDDPCLYRLHARLHAMEDEDEAISCFGFRDFRVVNGYFQLNGRRIFVRSTHTGNHVPFGQVVPPAKAPDLLRRDLLNAKTSGFNMVRFISGLAYPYEISICDELGLLVYEETLASWLLEDSPRMKGLYENCIREMILRDRNHPSVVIWGMLNETKDGAVFREAVSALPLARSLDDSRLILLASGRFDGHLEIGSVSNPGSSEWEHTWGAEAPGAPVVAMQYPSGTGCGDFHLYPTVPQTAEVNRMMRTLGQDSKPIFLSEYGIGSMMNVIHEARMYEQAGVPEDAEDFVLMRSMADRLQADWTRFAMEAAYPYPETLLKKSQEAMAHQRLLGFHLIRSNPKICGFNLTGMLDHAMTGEGVWRFWRDWKPGVFDAVCDGWAPVRWCLFAEPLHAYIGRPITLEAVLANEDVLAPGLYPAEFKVWGPSGIAWQRQLSVSIPISTPAQDGPLAIPVLKEEVVLQGPAGVYELIPSMQRAAPPETGWKFHLSDPNSLPTVKQAVTTWHVPRNVELWLAVHGVQIVPFDTAPHGGRELILVGNVSEQPASSGDWRQIATRMAAGSTIVFLSPQAFQREKDAAFWLPLAKKGRVFPFSDFLYHKECVAKPHPVFAGLQGEGILDWDYYGAVWPHYLFDGQDTPSEVIAAAFAAGYSTAGGYASGVLMGSYKFGDGRFVVNSFPILEHIDSHPVADRLLLNFIQYYATTVQTPAVALPANFNQQLKGIGYPD